MKNTALLIIAAFLFVSGAAYSDSTEEVLNVQGGSTKLKFSGKLNEAAINALSSGEEVFIQNNLGNYLSTPTQLTRNKKGLAKKTGTQKISFKSKNGKYSWTEKDVSQNFSFSIGNERVRPIKAVLKSSGTLTTRDFTDFDKKDITLLDVLSKEKGLDKVAGYSFKPKKKGTNFTHSSEAQDLQVNFAANSKGKASISYVFSPKAVSPAFTGENSSTNQPGPGPDPGKWDEDDIKDGDQGETKRYLIVNLQTGKIRYRNNAPANGWLDKHKTAKMVLRRITPDTFMMGSRDFEVGRSSGEVWHKVTLTKPYYIGVFEVTQKQYELITGGNPSDFKGDLRPVHSVKYTDIRGEENGIQWPMERGIDGTSFLGKLRQKTNLSFDLPTEAQWEYACRARTTVAWNSGKVSTNSDEDPELNDLGRYQANTTDGKGGYEGITTVGSYLPNAWGLYDMHGNVREWCLDWYDSYSEDDVTDPVGPNYARNSYNQRVLRSGGANAYGSSSYLSKAEECRSAARDYGKQSNSNERAGFRLALFTNEGTNDDFVDPVPGIDEDDIKDGDKGNTKTYLIINLTNGDRRYRDTEPDGGWPESYKTNKMVFRRITPGEFKMGSRDFEVGRSSGEVWHKVTLTQPYYISVFEMTQSQYKQIAGGNPATFKGDLRPVDVTYKDIRGYDKGIQWPMGKEFDENSLLGRIQEITKLHFDLPTEAQWEYACRARTTVAWNSGKVSTGEDEDPELDNLGRYKNNSKDGKGGYENTTAVGSYLPNAWGLYDMHGNVWEWCLDWYGDYSGDDAVDPVGPNFARNSYEQRVIRGGGYYKSGSYTVESKASECRSAARSYQGRQYHPFGIRLALLTEEGVNEEFHDYVPGPIDEDDIGDGDTGKTQKYLIINLENGDWRYRDTEPKGGWTDVYKTNKMVFRLVSPGSFMMGSPGDEVGRSSEEIQHEVTLTQPYYISVFEMTQSQYKQIAGGNPATFKGDLRPVDVTYKDIRGYDKGIQWPMGKEFDENSILGRIQEITKRHIDLPTEAQWEYACRAGTTTAWNNGKKSTNKDADPELDNLGRYKNNSTDGKGGYENTTTVGSYLPNAWGLYDMHGNVWEWCLDWYGDYSGDDAVDPVGPNYARNSYEQRVIRGGGYYKSGSYTVESKASECRSAARSYQGRQYLPFGIRLILEP